VNTAQLPLGAGRDLYRENRYAGEIKIREIRSDVNPESSHLLPRIDSLGPYGGFPYIAVQSWHVARGEAMTTAKTTTLTFRIEPEPKAALRTAALREHRSVANRVAVLIRDHCGRNEFAIAEQRRRFDEGRDSAKPGK